MTNLCCVWSLVQLLVILHSFQSLSAFLHPTGIVPKVSLHKLKTEHICLGKVFGQSAFRKSVLCPIFVAIEHQTSQPTLDVSPESYNTHGNKKKPPEKITIKNVNPIILSERDLDEKFVRCTGNGGQKVNKSSSKVDLVHIPTGVKVSCQDFRDLSSNRERARKLIRDKLDLHFNGKLSKIGVTQGLVRKRKKSAARYRLLQARFVVFHSSCIVDADTILVDLRVRKRKLYLILFCW